MLVFSLILLLPINLLQSGAAAAKKKTSEIDPDVIET